MPQALRVIVLACISISVMLSLGGCDDQSSSSNTSGSTTGAAAPSTSTAAALSITGTPPASIVVGSKYTFSPKVNGAAGETLKFSISNMPEWATFDASTGLLSGIPTSGSVGKTAAIGISVVTSAGGAKLAPFAITVTGGAAVATITWATPPVVANVAAGLQVAGYHIYYGTSPTSLTHETKVADPTLTSYVINNLASGMWYFAVAAYDADDVESPHSSTIAAML
jgi:Putative Ig domain